jgi:hypothetical protein
MINSTVTSPADQWTLSWPSSRGRHTRAARWVATARAGVGLCCLLAPHRLLPAGERDSAATRRVMRVLGARHLAQAGVEMARPTPAVLALGAGVDALHAVSCLGFAVLGGARWRRGVLLNAGGALGFCVATATTAALADITADVTADTPADTPADTTGPARGKEVPGPVRAQPVR